MENNELRMRTKRNRTRILVLATAVAIASGIGIDMRKNAFAQSTLPSPQDLSRTFINVAKQVKPAIVNIDVVETNA
jgi:hypothetical protein